EKAPGAAWRAQDSRSDTASLTSVQRLSALFLHIAGHFLRQISPLIFLRSQTLFRCSSTPATKCSTICSKSSSSSQRYQSGEVPKWGKRTSTKTGGEFSNSLETAALASELVQHKTLLIASLPSHS